MQKNILFSILLTVFSLGLYGCSCSQANKSTHELAPGLYLSELAIDEGNSGENVVVTMNVTLQRENTETVTVDYTISAIDPEGRVPTELAVVGAVDVPEVDVIAGTDTLEFSEATGNVQTISIELVGDTIYEHDEKFLVTLSGASAGVEIVAGSVEAVIKNDDAVPVVTLSRDSSAPTILAEEFTGVGMTPPANTQIKLTLDKPSRVDAKVAIVGSIEPAFDVLGAKLQVGKTAAHRIDYLIMGLDGRVYLGFSDQVVIPAGDSEVTLEIKVIDDGIAENEEKFFLNLDPQSDVSSFPSISELEFSIADNDSSSGLKIAPLNDTGLVKKLTDLNAEYTAELDGSIGLDVQQSSAKTGGGRAGFDYTKIGSDGAEVDANVVYNDEMGDNMPWSCVRDNVTGLLWEVKTRGNTGVRSESQSYYWFDPNYSTNGGFRGEAGNDVCSANNLDNGCNTSYYVADMNHIRLCGMTGWRLPTVEELRGLVDYGVTSDTSTPGVPEEDISLVAYDTDYFIGDVTGISFTWSSTTDTNSPERARIIQFRTPSFEESRIKDKSFNAGIRLVNDSLLSTMP